MRVSAKAGCAGLIMLGALVFPAGSAALNITDDFTANNEGWTVTQGDGTFQNPPPYVPAPYSPSGGNPGGMITFTDSNGDAGGFFDSGPDWSGNAMSNYGGTITYDIASNDPSPQFPAAIFPYSGTPFIDAIGLQFVSQPALGASFTTRSVTLLPENSLEVQEEGMSVDRADTFLRTGLFDLDGLIIFGEADSDTGETTMLDNVSISGGSDPGPLVHDRSISIKAGKKSVSGVVEPDSEACPRIYGDGRRGDEIPGLVIAWKQKQGDDFPIASDDALGGVVGKPSGYYKVKTGKLKPGKYYVTLRGGDSLHYANHSFEWECTDETSETVRVKRD